MDNFPVSEIERIAIAAARDASPDVEVVGVTLNTGGSDYVEILVDVRGCQATPCHVLVGVFRNRSEARLRADIAVQLRTHLDEHRR